MGLGDSMAVGGKSGGGGRFDGGETDSDGTGGPVVADPMAPSRRHRRS